MNAAQLTALLNDLSARDWQALAAGQALHLVDDQRLAVGAEDGGRPLWIPADDSPAGTAELRDVLQADAADLLESYYRTTPLSRAGFDRQVAALIETHGAEAFAAVDGQRPQRTLFVDGGEVVAESADSPRHPYGACCELEQPGDSASQVRNWLQRGEAYERYLSMNVCRYNC